MRASFRGVLFGTHWEALLTDTVHLEGAVAASQGVSRRRSSMSPDTERIAIDDVSQQVLRRFVVRSVVIVFLALIVQGEFWQSLALLLFVGGFICSCAALLKNEASDPHSLNYWDESVGHYAVLLFIKALGLA